MKFLFTLALSALNVNAYWLMGIGSLFLLRTFSCLLNFFSENFITTERIDPVVSKNKMTASAHVHTSRFWSFIFLFFINFNHRNFFRVVFGGSNLRFNTSTASLRQSQCTSVPIPQDKSAYWFPVSSFPDTYSRNY